MLDELSGMLVGGGESESESEDGGPKERENNRSASQA